VFDKLVKIEDKQLKQWIPRWERVRRRGRSRYIWLRIVPLFLGYDAFVAYKAVPYFIKSHPDFARFSIYVPLTLPISALIGYVSGSIWWQRLEWRYVDATRDMDASNSTE